MAGFTPTIQTYNLLLQAVQESSKGVDISSFCQRTLTQMQALYATPAL